MATGSMKVRVRLLRNVVLMADAQDVALAVHGDAHALACLRTAVDEMRHLPPRQRDLDRPADLARRDRGQDGLRADAGLAAEAAADIGREHADLSRRRARARQRSRPCARFMNCRLERIVDAVAAPAAMRRMRLQRGGEMVRRGVGRVERDCGLGQRRVEIAHVLGRAEARGRFVFGFGEMRASCRSGPPRLA